MPNIASMPGMPDFKSFFSAFLASELSFFPPTLAWDCHHECDDEYGQYDDDDYDDQFDADDEDGNDDEYYDRFDDDDGCHLLIVLHHLHHHVVQRAEHWARVGEVEGDLGK